MRNGGASAVTRVTALAAAASSGTVAGAAPSNSASTESDRSAWWCARSVNGYQATTADTWPLVSPASAASAPPADSPHVPMRSASNPYAGANLPQVVDRGVHVVDLRREDRFTGEPVVDGGHRDARGHETIKDRIRRVRLRQDPPVTGVEAAAVDPDDQWRQIACGVVGSALAGGTYRSRSSGRKPCNSAYATSA